jgi:predicted O-methyltransferase YrrM
MGVVSKFKNAARPHVHKHALRLAERLDPRSFVLLPYPPTADNRPRYGYGRPEHAGIAAALAEHEDSYRDLLDVIASYYDDLGNIARVSPGGAEPYWLSAWLPGMDAAALYALIRHWKPGRYVEVGSGISTSFVHQARVDGGLTTEIISIDPHPRAGIDALCDQVIRRPLELADLEVFRSLSAGDVVFIDNSHSVYMNSDVVAALLDVLPALPHGVFVGIHDILWPIDYPPMWSEYWFSEQYVVGAYLLARTPWLKPVLSLGYVSERPELHKCLDVLWNDPHWDEVDRRGFGLWFEIDRT